VVLLALVFSCLDAMFHFLQRDADSLIDTLDDHVKVRSLSGFDEPVITRLVRYRWVLF